MFLICDSKLIIIKILGLKAYDHGVKGSYTWKDRTDTKTKNLEKVLSYLMNGLKLVWR